MVTRLGLSLGVLLAAAAFLVACQDAPGDTKPGPTGQGGAGGCPTGPHPSFTLQITAADGHVPLDTQVGVIWSAGKEPVFALNDPATWKTLEAANIVCAVDPKSPPPTALMMLSCELWTSGATEIVVKAVGYTTSDQTYTQKDSPTCHGPVATPVLVKLVRPVDGGPP